MYEAIAALVPQWSEPDCPGGAIGVVRDGHVVVHLTAGLANIEHGVPVTQTTRFPIASVTKQMVSAALVILAARGRLSLDDQVGRYFPLQAGGSATIRQLLQMTSGLRDTGELFRLRGVWWRYPGMHADGLELLARQRTLNFPVGERYIYTNVNYGLAGTLIERLTDRSLDSALRELLFGPLGMGDSHVRDDGTEVTPRLAAGYVPSAGRFEACPWSFGISGAGSVVSTIGDLLTWQAALIAGEIGGVPVTAELARSGILSDGTPTGYGLGLHRRRYRGLDVLSHTGSLAGIRALSVIVPAAKTSFAMLSNRDDTDYHLLWRNILDVVLADRFPEPKPGLTTPPARAAPILGSWVEPSSGELMTISRDSEGIVRADKLGYAMLLQPSGERSWRFDYGMFPVSIEEDGEALAMAFGGARHRFVRAPQPPATSPLADYAGRYANADLLAEHEVFVEGGVLRVRQGPPFQTDAVYALKPVLPDLFAIEAGRPGWSYKASVRFLRGADGRVASFNISTERLKDMVFGRIAA